MVDVIDVLEIIDTEGAVVFEVKEVVIEDIRNGITILRRLPQSEVVRAIRLHIRDFLS